MSRELSPLSSARSAGSASARAPRRSWSLGVGLLSAAGVAVALYLTSLHYGGSAALCTGIGDCETVNQSEYATVGPIPVAMLGLAAYLTRLFAVLAAWLRPQLHSAAPLLVFGVALAGVLYSLYLTYLELFVIDAICPWCVVSAVLLVAILLVATREVVAPPS